MTKDDAVEIVSDWAAHVKRNAVGSADPFWGVLAQEWEMFLSDYATSVKAV